MVIKLGTFIMPYFCVRNVDRKLLYMWNIKYIRSSKYVIKFMFKCNSIFSLCIVYIFSHNLLCSGITLLLWCNYVPCQGLIEHGLAVCKTRPSTFVQLLWLFFKMYPFIVELLTYDLWIWKLTDDRMDTINIYDKLIYIWFFNLLKRMSG